MKPKEENTNLSGLDVTPKLALSFWVLYYFVCVRVAFLSDSESGFWHAVFFQVLQVSKCTQKKVRVQLWFTYVIYIYICICVIMYTSSTAQGGGGSFKNRKPIGEVGCCESGMAKRIHWWTERCLRSPLCLSLSLTIYLPTSLSSMYLSIYRSISLFLSFI